MVRNPSCEANESMIPKDEQELLKKQILGNSNPTEKQIKQTSMPDTFHRG